MLSKDLLSILCCPKCKGDCVYDEHQSTLTCKNCGTIYKVVNDIPIMLPDEEE